MINKKNTDLIKASGIALDKLKQKKKSDNPIKILMSKIISV